jgi:dTDP-4-amino-4,6-dideoxygalactose transaminase
MKDADALAAAWQQLPASLDQRRRKANMYSEMLEGGPWRLLEGWRSSGVCWRYSLLVDLPDSLTPFSESVRRDGFHVSNLYWPVNQFFLPSDLCPNADWFARRVVNLWVDDTVDKDTANRCADSLLRHSARFLA